MTEATPAVPTAGKRSITSFVSLLALVAVLVAVPAAIYFLYVVAQFKAIEQRDLRVLAETGKAIEDIAETAAKNLGTFLDSGAGSESNRQPGIVIVAPPSEPDKSVKPNDPVAAFFTRQAALDRVKGLFWSDADRTQKCAYDVSSSRTFNASTLIFQLSCGAPSQELPTNKDNPDAPSRSLIDVARLNLDSVLERVPLTSTLAKVVVVSRSGAVIAQHTPPPDFTIADGAETNNGLRIGSITSLQRADAAGNKVDATRLVDQTAIERVVIAGVTYELACQPLRLELTGWNAIADSAGKESSQSSTDSPDTDAAGPDTDIDVRRDENVSLAVCGFVPEDVVRSEALQVAPTLLLVLVALTGFGILAWPILKVLSLAPSEGVRRGDTFAMLLSSLCILMFATIAWLDAATYQALRDGAFGSLRTVAKEAETNVLEEFCALQTQLQKYDTQLDSFAGSADSESMFSNLFTAPPDGSPRKAASLRSFTAPPRGEPTYFRSFFWMLDTGDEDDGQQIVKGTVRKSNTPAINLSGRAYFQRIKRERAWDSAFQERCKEPVRQVYVETSRSLTTGEFFTALSLRSKAKIDGKALVAAILGPMASFDAAALSSGLELSVVDESGVAVFHTDPRRARAERIFRDEGVGARIRSAVSARVEQCFSGNYRGHPRLLCVRPLEGLPWSVVVSQRREPLFAANIEIIASAVTYAFAYIFVLILLTIAIVFKGAWERWRHPSQETRLSPRWMWPHLLPASGYWKWTRIGLFCIATLVLVSIASSSNRVLIVLPIVVAGMILFLMLREADRGNGAAKPTSFSQGAYVAAASLLWFFIAVLPAIGIFNAVVDAEFPRLVAAEQTAFIRRLETRSCRIAEEFDGYRFTSDTDREEWALARINDRRGVYRAGLLTSGEADSCGDKTWKEIGGTGLTRLHRLVRDAVADLKPLYNETATAVRYVGITEPSLTSQKASTSPGDGAVTRIHQCENTIRLTTLPDIGACGVNLSEFKKAVLPRSPVLSNIGFLLPLCAVFLLATLVAFVWYSARSMFLVSMPKTRGSDLPTLLGQALVKPTFAILSTREQYRYCKEQSGLPVVDITQLARESVPPDARAVIVTGVEELPGDDYEGRRRLQALLELCDSDGPRPMILCFHDPRGFWDGADALPAGLAGTADTPRSSIHADDHRAAWLQVLKLCDTEFVAAGTAMDGTKACYADCFTNLCSDTDRLVLYQVATTGFANPEHADSVQRLLDRGLLVCDPVLGIADHGFASYIREEQSRKDLEAALGQGGVSGSNRSRWIFAILLGAALVFLTATQREVVEVWLQFIVAASAGAAALLKASSVMLGSGEN